LGAIRALVIHPLAQSPHPDAKYAKESGSKGLRMGNPKIYLPCQRRVGDTKINRHWSCLKANKAN